MAGGLIMGTDIPGANEPRMFDLNRPQGYAKDDYLWQWKVANDTVMDIIRRNNSGQNIKDIVTAVMFSISLIAHDDKRRAEEIYFHSALNYINYGVSIDDTKKKAVVATIINDTSLSSEQKVERIIDVCNVPNTTASWRSDETLRICAITMGNLTSYVDQFRGLAHTLKVGELYNQEKSYARITHAFGKPIDPDNPDVIEL